jgi:hypothetical protein
LCDLILSPQRRQITFHDTKNGDSVTAYLHQAAAEVLAEYLQHRGRLERRGAAISDRSPPSLLDARPRTLPELVDKCLVCWCAPKPCHGAVLLELIRLHVGTFLTGAGDVQGKLL